MRPITTPDGKTHADLSDPDRRTFARAKDLVLQLGYYEWGNALRKTANIVADGLTVLLERPAAEPDPDDPDSEANEEA